MPARSHSITEKEVKVVLFKMFATQYGVFEGSANTNELMNMSDVTQRRWEKVLHSYLQPLI